MKARSVAVLFSILFVVSCAVAQQQDDSEQNKKWDPVVELQLTPEQADQFNALRDSKRSSMKEFRTKMQNLQKEYQIALQDQTVPKEKLYEYIDQMTSVESSMKKLNLDFMFRLRDILTHEQYAKFLEHQKATHEKKDEKHKKQRRSDQPEYINKSINN